VNRLEFQKALIEIENDNSVLDLCRKFVLHGMPFIFKDNEENYYEFRKRIGLHLDVSFNDVYISGSAKLGFSPHKDTDFSFESDVDVTIISQERYNIIMKSVGNFQMKLRDNRKAVTDKEISMYHDFLEYTAIGWIRPDKLPFSFGLDIIKSDWFDFFKAISYGRSEVGNYKVSAAVFATYKHYENYIYSGIKKLKKKFQARSV
jgi:hypothetical protein